MSTSIVPSVVDFYSNKSIFVTGASGFIGKVLVEKLLRSCPNIDKIYLLMRPGRNGTTPQQRLENDFIKSRVFEFNKIAVNLSSKLVAISGDLTKENLGISAPDRQTLIDNVSVVFHSAATVRFHGPLTEFISQNVAGTKSIMDLARAMTKLKAVVYVSTAYANCNLIEVEEKVYPLHANAQTLIDDILLKNSDKTPNVGHPSLLGRPNSYTLSKSIAECLVKEQYSDLPVVICRPSIVTHAFKDPINGWCDSMNGLAGTLLLGGLGIARTMDMDCDFKADIIPVDFVANSLIVVGWHTANMPHERKQVIHLTSGVKNPIKWGEILDFARISAVNNPSIKMIRPIAKNPVSSKNLLGKVNHFIVKLFSHFLFAYIFDSIMFVVRKKPVMVKITNKMHKAFDVLEHFTNQEWCFRYENYNEIYNLLSDNEKAIYESNVRHIDWIDYCHSLYMGSRRYLLNEDDSTIEDGKKRQKLLTIVYGVLNVTIYSTLGLTTYFLASRLF